MHTYHGSSEPLVDLIGGLSPSNRNQNREEDGEEEAGNRLWEIDQMVKDLAGLGTVGNN